MKADHMGNGQLKPAYNVQIGTEHQFIINYTFHQEANDMPVLKEHLQSTKAQLAAIGQPMPQRLSADAGYGSEENYDYIEQEGLENYVKYPGFYHEQKKSTRQDPFRRENLYFNSEHDYFVCPMGQHLTFTHTTIDKVSCEFGILAIAHNLKKMWSAKHKDHIVPIGPNLPSSDHVLADNTQINTLEYCSIEWQSPIAA